jgi:CDGSH-type Zn-finger protein
MQTVFLLHQSIQNFHSSGEGLFSHQTKTKNMATTKITVNNNGSLRVEGDFEIVDKEGNKYDLGGRDVVSICRCGMSKNKPFCDGSHKGHFEHEAIAFALPPKKTI